MWHWIRGYTLHNLISAVLLQKFSSTLNIGYNDIYINLFLIKIKQTINLNLNQKFLWFDRQSQI